MRRYIEWYFINWLGWYNIFPKDMLVEIEAEDPREQEACVKFIQRMTKWEALRTDLEEKVLSHAREQGAKRFGVLGKLSSVALCWLVCQGDTRERDKEDRVRSRLWR